MAYMLISWWSKNKKPTTKAEKTMSGNSNVSGNKNTKQVGLWQKIFGSNMAFLKNPIDKEYTYEHGEYDLDLFPASAEIVEGGYVDDWRDNLEGLVDSSWVYRDHKDILRRRIIYFAEKTSLNIAPIPNSYNPDKASPLTIEIRQPSDRLSCVALKLVDGHITTNSKNKSLLHVRFDDDEIECYEWDKSGSDIGTVIIYKDADKLIERLKNAKHAVFELPLYIRGETTDVPFIFDLSGLVWEHKTRLVDSVTTTPSIDKKVEKRETDEDDFDNALEFEEPMSFEDSEKIMRP